MDALTSTTLAFHQALVLSTQPGLMWTKDFRSSLIEMACWWPR
jgi:hypothetical protein